MGVFRRSLAEDKVDQYTHTWSVLFLLVLALVTWFLPLSPNLQLQNQPAASAGPSVVSPVTSPERVPRFQASCWCPAQFTSGMVAYTQAACSAAYNLALHGVDSESHDIGTILSHVNFGVPGPVSPGDPGYSKFKPVTRKPSSQKPQVKVNILEGEELKQREKTKNALYFIQIKTPFVLFLLAVCLKIPHLVWTLLSTLTGGINIDQMLTSAKAGAGLSSESRRQLHGELASAAAERVRVCSKTASCLYLLLKILVCVAVIAELVVVHKSLLPQAQSLEDDLKPTDLNRDVMRLVDETLKTLETTEKDNSTDFYKTYSNQILQCELPIRQFANIKKYTVQCIFNAERQSVPPKPPTQSPSPADDHVDQTPHVVKMYVAVYLIVQIYLVVLTVVNVSSFLLWLLKLVVDPCRPRVSSDLDLCVDVRLLLHMAHENAGPEVVKAFSQSEAWGSGDGKEVSPHSE